MTALSRLHHVYSAISLDIPYEQAKEFAAALYQAEREFRLARDPAAPLALSPRESQAAEAFITELSRPECPECHSTDVYETEVETREIVAGEMVTMRGTAFDCIDCHHMWEAEEES